MPDANGRPKHAAADQAEDNEHTSLLRNSGNAPAQGRRASSTHSGYFFERVAEGMQERDRKRMANEVIRYASFIWAVISWYAAVTIV